LPAAQDAAIAEACSRIRSMGDGATVTWKPAPMLSPELAASLKSGDLQRKDDTPDLPACLIVPALGAERMLVGAFMIEHGTLDRDTYVVARDLAARLALVIERAQAVSELDDARRLAALGQFAAAIAHDIRTPLTSISLNVQILRQKLHLSDDDREHLDIALEELARLDKSVAEILDFAKPVKLAQQSIDVGELIETTARGLSSVMSEKGVALECDLPADLPTVQGDPQRLRQVLVNLVGNAAEASTRGNEVTVRAKPADASHVAIEVVDHGRGIKADDLPRIFEPFFTTRPDGTGLGLAICHKVVRAHGGDIQVRSIVGEGSTFTILLPAA
jgi:signal transduction histidine kinase